ncbi:CCAAT-box DNA binding protein subunit B [Plasmodium falciparum RAJ116]|uniref:CCAAT-box DNA binding protein subunit B n=1 Tax=Plasmodium falciparum RAJ116 TaxID=580058 RepID=A0A0L0CWE2_PLAFA|nr:CCAAT-box DNA binding protein subunit B [Plasmodium falciparum RAJ116]
MNEVLYEFYTFSKLFNETSYESYNLHYIIHFYSHILNPKIKIIFHIHQMILLCVKNYYYSVSLISIKNRKLYYFNSINEQSNNLNIHLKNYIILPEHHWTILAVINLTHINKLGYHCLVGGTNGNSHICINGFDLSIGVLINLQNEYIYEEQLSLEDSFTSISDTLNGFSLLNEYMKVDSITKEKNNNNNDDDDDLLCNSYDKKINKYNNNVSDFDNVHIRNANKSYSTFCGCGYNLQNELNKNILITTTCRNYEQTFFINSTKVGITQACLDPITCIGNCASINNEFLSPFGSYKFLRIIFDSVGEGQKRQFFFSLKFWEKV